LKVIGGKRKCIGDYIKGKLVVMKRQKHQILPCCDNSKKAKKQDINSEK